MEVLFSRVEHLPSRLEALAFHSGTGEKKGKKEKKEKKK